MTREPSTPPYPADPQTNTITLPVDIQNEVVQRVAADTNVAAIQCVLQLTGAGLKLSKDYVDTLERTRTPRPANTRDEPLTAARRPSPTASDGPAVPAAASSGARHDPTIRRSTNDD